MLTKIYQSRLHKPDQGMWGDCHRACYATILGKELWEVPHFYDEGRSGTEARKIAQEFLDREGLVELSAGYEGDADHRILLAIINEHTPNVPFILSGMSKNGTNHSVVALNGDIYHDPSLDQSGIIGPTDTGHWWVVHIAGRLKHWEYPTRKWKMRDQAREDGIVVVAGESEDIQQSGVQLAV